MDSIKCFGIFDLPFHRILRPTMLDFQQCDDIQTVSVIDIQNIVNPNNICMSGKLIDGHIKKA